MRRLGTLLVCAMLMSCGVPTGDPPQRIAASDVPYGLARSTPPTHDPPSPAPTVDAPRVYFTTTEDRLVPRPRDVGHGPREERLSELLAHLAAGPTEEELAAQLSTALRPDAELSVDGVEHGVATLAIQGDEGGQNSGESRRAVAQIVLTATSLPGIDAVLLSSDGEQVEAPLPSGELTTAPLTAEDYNDLLAPAVPRK